MTATLTKARKSYSRNVSLHPKRTASRRRTRDLFPPVPREPVTMCLIVEGGGARG